MKNSPLQFLIVITLLVTFSVTACKEKSDELSGDVENLKFTQLMEATPFSGAEYIAASENGQYIILSYQGELTTISHYFSIDGGQSFELLTGKYSTIDDRSKINTYISNDGKFIYNYQNNKLIYELNPAGGINNSIYAENAFALTESGKVVSYQYDENLGQSTYFIFENGAYVSTGLANVLDPATSFAGVSGDKIGFLGNNKLAEFDVNTKTYQERSTLGVDFNILKGNSNNSEDIKKAYSQGYFTYAWQKGLLTISPSDQVTYSYYPTEFHFYLQTRGSIVLDRDKVYVQVYANEGKYAIYETTGINGAELEVSELSFPLAITSKGLISQGFIEGGNRLQGGIYTIENNTKSYIDFSFESTIPKEAFKVGNYLYMNDKRFDIDSKTFHNTGIGRIMNVYNDNNQTIAYTTTGTYTSTDDKNWTIQAEDQPKPNLITKDDQGTFHALGIENYIYYLGGTGFSVYKFNQYAYTSGDGINWQLVDEKSGLDGGGPGSLMPDGTSGFTYNTNPLGNQLLYSQFTFDYGITYEGFPAGTEPTTYKLFDHYTANGRFVKANFESSDGLLYIEICHSDKSTCKEIVVTPTFDSSESYATAAINYTENDEMLIVNKDGIFLTSKL